MTREQFITQVKATQKAFRRFLVALCCGDSQLADDIAQEAYMKSYLALDTIEDDAKFKSWLFRIGYNTFISNRRSEHPCANLDQVAETASPKLSDDRSRYEALYRALDRLTPKERTTILLFYMEGYSVKEIADIENIAQTTARQYLCRGRFHLKDLLEN